MSLPWSQLWANKRATKKCKAPTCRATWRESYMSVCTVTSASPNILVRESWMMRCSRADKGSPMLSSVSLILLNKFSGSHSACWKNSEKRLGALKGQRESRKGLRHKLWQEGVWESLSPHITGYTCCVISAGDSSIHKQSSDCLVVDCAAVAALQPWNGCISVVDTATSISPKRLGIVLVRKVLLPGCIFTIFHTDVCLEGKHLRHN